MKKTQEGMQHQNDVVEHTVPDEVANAVREIKNNKALGPDGIPSEAWKKLRLEGIHGLISLFSSIPNPWRKSNSGPIHKGKDDTDNSTNYRGIKLMNHTRKAWERVIGRLGSDVDTSENYHGFMIQCTAGD